MHVTINFSRVVQKIKKTASKTRVQHQRTATGTRLRINKAYQPVTTICAVLVLVRTLGPRTGTLLCHGHCRPIERANRCQFLAQTQEHSTNNPILNPVRQVRKKALKQLPPPSKHFTVQPCIPTHHASNDSTGSRKRTAPFDDL